MTVHTGRIYQHREAAFFVVTGAVCERPSDPYVCYRLASRDGVPVPGLDWQRVHYADFTATYKDLRRP